MVCCFSFYLLTGSSLVEQPFIHSFCLDFIPSRLDFPVSPSFWPLKIYNVCVYTQSCPTLCDPMDCSPPGSSVHGNLQARIVVWVAIPFSMGSSQPRDWTWVSCITGRFFAIWATSETRYSHRRNWRLHLDLDLVCSFCTRILSWENNWHWNGAQAGLVGITRLGWVG